MARRNGPCCHSLVTIYGCLFHHVCIYLIFSTFISRFFYWLIIWGLACKSIFKYISSRLISLFEMNIFFTCCDCHACLITAVNVWCLSCVSVWCWWAACFWNSSIKCIYWSPVVPLEKKTHCVFKKTNKKTLLSKFMFIIIIHVFSHYESIIDIKTTVTTTIPKNNLKKKRWPPLTPQSESQLK